MQMCLLWLDTAAACGYMKTALCYAIGTQRYLSQQFPRPKQAFGD